MPKRACAGEWRGAGAGGSPQHATFFANQQFRLKLSGLQQDFRVTLTQAPLGATPKGGEHACHEMGVVVLVAPDAEGCAGAKSLGKPTRDGKLGYSGVAAVPARVRRRAAGGGAAAAGARQLPVPAGALHARGEGRGRLRPRGLLQFSV